MTISVQCSCVDCAASFDVGMESDWSFEDRKRNLIFSSLDYGKHVLLVAMPEGWQVDRIDSGDAVIHCPEHADG